MLSGGLSPAASARALSAAARLDGLLSTIFAIEGRLLARYLEERSSLSRNQFLRLHPTCSRGP